MMSLSLSYPNMEMTLARIDDPVAITELNCADDSRIRAVPAGIEKLVSLQRLNLSNTGIQSLPGAITQLTSLTLLDLSGTSISYLPGELLQVDRPLTVILLDCPRLVRANFRDIHPQVTLVLPE